MRRAAMGIALGLLLTSRAASAQVAEPSPAPAAPAESTDPAPSAQESRPSQTVLRLGLAGAYRSLYDLSILGGGVAFSYGGDGRVSGHFNLRMITARTLGGLGVFEGAPSGTVEFALDDGLRFGLGAGIALFTVNRATSGGLIMSCGPEGILRLGYDFGQHGAAYVLADFDIEWQAGAPVWGPTLQLGYRF